MMDKKEVEEEKSEMQIDWVFFSSFFFFAAFNKETMNFLNGFITERDAEFSVLLFPREKMRE